MLKDSLFLLVAVGLTGACSQETAEDASSDTASSLDDLAHTKALFAAAVRDNDVSPRDLEDVLFSIESDGSVSAAESRWLASVLSTYGSKFEAWPKQLANDFLFLAAPAAPDGVSYVVDGASMLADFDARADKAVADQKLWIQLQRDLGYAINVSIGWSLPADIRALAQDTFDAFHANHSDLSAGGGDVTAKFAAWSLEFDGLVRTKLVSAATRKKAGFHALVGGGTFSATRFHELPRAARASFAMAYATVSVAQAGTSMSGDYHLAFDIRGTEPGPRPRAIAAPLEVTLTPRTGSAPLLLIGTEAITMAADGHGGWQGHDRAGGTVDVSSGGLSYDVQEPSSRDANGVWWPGAKLSAYLAPRTMNQFRNRFDWLPGDASSLPTITDRTNGNSYRSITEMAIANVLP